MAEEQASDEKPHKCKECNKGFKWPYLLTKHEAVHSEDKPYVCNICKAKFKSISSFREHKMAHRGEKPYHCEYCNKKFIKRYWLKRHMKRSPCGRDNNKEQHVLAAGGSASNCGENTTTGLKHHEKSHLKKWGYTCDICKRTFPRKPSLVRHMKLHTGDTPYQCQSCKKSFVHVGRLRRHIKVTRCGVPEIDETHVLAAEGADSNRGEHKSAEVNEGLKHHEKGHLKKKRRYTCDICKRTFTETKTLVEHMKLHTGDTPYQCQSCKKSFVSVRRLRQHLKKTWCGLQQMHEAHVLAVEGGDHNRGEDKSAEVNEGCPSPENASPCTGSASSRNSNRQGGPDSFKKKDEKPHKCNKCNKGFKYPSLLTRHKAVHYEEKPYVCNICKAKFKVIASLRIHKKTHRADELYHCQRCNRNFTCAHYLRKHLKRSRCGRDNNQEQQVLAAGGSASSSGANTTTDAKLFKCDTCDKTFKFLSWLRCHEVKHSTERLYSCDICKASFKAKRTLTRHKKLHTEGRR